MVLEVCVWERQVTQVQNRRFSVCPKTFWMISNLY